MNTSFHPLLVRHTVARASACLAAILASGCEVRDEEARGGAATPWPHEIVERLAMPSHRAPASPSTTKAIEYIDGYAAGVRRANDAGLPMLIVFRATWCRWSETFVAELPSQPKLIDVAGRFVCVAVDADRDPATCRSFGVQAYPTVIVLDRERRETYRASGAAARTGLAVAVQAVLEDPARRIAVQPAATPR